MLFRSFDLDDAAFDQVLQAVDDAPLASSPRVFVLAGAGRATAGMRALRRAGVGFCAGIVAENDVDCVLARRLSSHVESVPAFCEVDEAALARGLEALAGCEAVLDCLGKTVGPQNERCRRLADAAREQGIPVFDDVKACLAAIGPGAGEDGGHSWKAPVGRHRGMTGRTGGALGRKAATDMSEGTGA